MDKWILHRLISQNQSDLMKIKLKFLNFKIYQIKIQAILIIFFKFYILTLNLILIS